MSKLDNGTESIDVSFVGSLTRDYPSRIRVLDQVCEIPGFGAWGPGVDELPPNSPLRAHYRGGAWGLDMYRVLRNSKITVNVHGETAGRYAVNMRLYEATGVGTLLVTDRKESLGEVFEAQSLVRASSERSGSIHTRAGSGNFCRSLGEGGPPERVDGAEIRFMPYEPDPQAVARFYQAADVYVHAARADNFPLTVLEAMACGLPVVATEVGGIPEQVMDGLTGLLVPPNDSEAMSGAVERLLFDEMLRRTLSTGAAKEAAERFDLSHQAEAYLAWYRDLLHGG